MTESEKTPAATATKKKLMGGRKGGTTFPRVNLERALQYADKLVSKTHTGALPESTILAGVFGSAGPDGQVRASALKQYGLMEGKRTAYKATELAKAIDAALDGEKLALLQKSLLSSKLFHKIFETYQNDTVSRAKIRQRAQALKVHPDSADECAGIFMDSAVTAGIATVTGDSITLLKAGAITAPPAAVDDDKAGEFELADDPEPAQAGNQGGVAPAPKIDDAQNQAQPSIPTKSLVNVNLTVDSSSDPEKLEKQLKLLKQFGLV
jgi:hypothetical protein